MRVHTPLIASIVYICLLCLLICSVVHVEAVRGGSGVISQHVADQIPLEVHVVTLTSKEHERTTERHAEEKRQLMQRLITKKGCTDRTHPRARLLTALHGFSRYEERNKADLQRWKDNYNHVSKHQKKVHFSRETGCPIANPR